MRIALIFSIGTVLLLLAGRSPATAEGNPENDALFNQLQHESMDVRISALRELQTSLDPRLPEALLVLLNDEGNSIRRLAARGIGSRYWQIPEDRIPAFVQALRTNANTEYEDEKEMVRRAVTLLTRTYDSPEVSRSPNGRWALYERYSLPCLIDTSTGSEELLGWNPEDRVRISSYLLNGGNDGNDGNSIWHPEKEMVAMIAAVARRESTMIAWVHGKGFKQLDHSKVYKALGANEAPNPHRPRAFGVKEAKGMKKEIPISKANDTNQNAAFTAPRQGSAVLVVGKGAASGKEEGKFSALLAPRQPDWVASQGCRKSQLRSKAVGLG